MASTDISIDQYLALRNSASFMVQNKIIHAFSEMISNNFEFMYIHSNPKDSPGYSRHAQEFYNTLYKFYNDLIYSNLYRNDIFTIINYISCSGELTPSFVTHSLLDFIKNEIVSTHPSYETLLPMMKDITANQWFINLLLEYMVNTFKRVYEMNMFVSVLKALGLDVAVVLNNWKSVAPPPYKDSADLLLKVYNK